MILRDFAVMLACLSELGYVNLSTRQNMESQMIGLISVGLNNIEYSHEKTQCESIQRNHRIPCSFETILSIDGEDIADLSERFNKKGLPEIGSPFENSGIMS